jgi:hypothetical protein
MRTLVQLGKALQVETLAEGIEDQVQLETLQREHCRYRLLDRVCSHMTEALKPLDQYLGALRSLSTGLMGNRSGDPAGRPTATCSIRLRRRMGVEA